MNVKIKNNNLFMNYAINISASANCIKGKIGAVLVKDNKIIAEGVNSVPNGITPCTEKIELEKDNQKGNYDLISLFDLF